ncbi:hypothetical protein RZS08_61655, partial [Arthrospira platensis SPKY1]|nr:hypothetical protein [Arthrospira platensis SPKY1]
WEMSTNCINNGYPIFKWLSTASTAPEITSVSNSILYSGQSEASLSVTSAANTILWYNTQIGGFPFHMGSTYTFNTTETTTFWVEPIGNGCVGERVAVTATVLP